MPRPTWRVHLGEDLGQVGVDPGDRRTGQRTGEVAVLTVRRAALGQVDAPVCARRDRLQPPFTGRSDDDGQRALGQGVGGAIIVGAQRRQAVACEHVDVRDAGCLAPRDDLRAVRQLERRTGDEHASPASTASRSREWQGCRGSGRSRASHQEQPRRRLRIPCSRPGAYGRPPGYRTGHDISSGDEPRAKTLPAPTAS